MACVLGFVGEGPYPMPLPWPRPANPAERWWTGTAWFLPTTCVKPCDRPAGNFAVGLSRAGRQCHVATIDPAWDVRLCCGTQDRRCSRDYADRGCSSPEPIPVSALLMTGEECLCRRPPQKPCGDAQSTSV